MKGLRTNWTLRRRLLLIAGVGILPVAIAAGVGLALLVSNQVRDARDKSLHVTRVAAAAIELELERSVTALDGLSISPMLDRGDLAGFTPLLERFLAQTPTWQAILLQDARGHVLAHTIDAVWWIGQPGLVEVVNRALQENRPRVGSLIEVGEKRWGVPVSTPVGRLDTTLVLTAVLPPQAFADIVASQSVPSDWTVSVFDARGARVARSHDHSRYVGTAAAPSLRKLLAENRPMGTGVTRTLENVEVNTAYVRLPDSQWTVAVGIPTATTDAAVADALALYGGGIAASILIALLAAALAARGISEPIHQLREAAERIGRGQLPRLPDTAIDELAHLGRSMEASAAELRRLEGERSEAMDQLRNVRDDLRERVADLEQINTLMQQLVQQDALDAQLQTVLGTLCNLNRGDKALITVADARTRQLQVRASCGLSAATVSTLERGIPGNSTCSRALLESRRIVIEDVESDPAFADFLEMARVEGVRSVHSMPIRTASQRLLGVVSVYRAQPGAPDERDLRLAELCAHTAAVVIERTLAEADAMESTRRLRFALDSSTVPFSILTPLRDVTGVVVDFTWFYLNRAAALDAGHPVEALRGQVVSQKAPHLWKISDLFDAYVAVAVRGEARELEVRADHDGSERWMHVVAAPFDDKVAVWSADVTHRVMQERALQAADRRKDDFLAILAHELRNPLAPIQHAATISSLAGATEAQQRWSREVIERQVKQMAMLLDDLLDVSRITRGKLELRKSVIDLRSTIEAAVETARPHIEARQHVLTLALPEERIALEADALRLAQVVTNLLVNAARYTERGGAIRLSAEYSAAGEVRIEVADNGNGIADADVEAIFEMFAQGSNRAAHGGGLGIGLALSRGIVRLHGGELRVHSDGLGLGSRFTVSLPLGAAQVIEAGADVPTLPALGRRLNVLIADDNRDAADTLATLMRLAGHSPRVAYEGASAVERFRAQPADVVLLDIGMPGMSGYEVARRIRSLQRSAQPPLIMAMSGWGQPKDKHAAADAGIDHHLTKPVTTQALMDVISAHFQDARSAA